MKVWITKYALSQGIEEVDAKLCDNCSTDMIEVEPEKPGYLKSYYHGEGKDWHKSRKAAVKRAEQMRDKKIVALEKQIEKLKKMKF